MTCFKPASTSHVLDRDWLIHVGYFDRTNQTASGPDWFLYKLMGIDSQPSTLAVPPTGPTGIPRQPPQRS
jgi:hypothetical protein